MKWAEKIPGVTPAYAKHIDISRNNGNPLLSVNILYGFRNPNITNNALGTHANLIKVIKFMVI